MKYDGGRQFRRTYQNESPYALLVRSLPRAMVDRIAARLASGEHEEDVARDENLVPGAVRLIGRSVTAVAGFDLPPAQLHRMRTLSTFKTPEQIAELEGLPINVVEDIVRRSESAARRREKRAEQNAAESTSG